MSTNNTTNKVTIIIILVPTLLLTSIAVYYRYKKSKPKPILPPPPPPTITSLIGNTPIIKLQCLSKLTQPWEVFIKCEHLNPFGSGKDRVALRIVQDALISGQLNGGTIVEGTSGSTGISLARVSLAMGLKCIVVVPDDQAIEKTNLLRMFGADVRKVKPVSIVHPDHYVNVARRIANNELSPKGYFANQFETESNFNVHYETTGPEIWNQLVHQLHRRIDLFVCSAGTGGTIAGISKYLKEQQHQLMNNNNHHHNNSASIHVTLADPQGSSLFHRVENGVMFAPEQQERYLKRNRIDTICEGIGIDRLTANFAKGIPYIDSALRITDRQAALMARYVLLKEGLFIGSSTAINLCAVLLTVLQWKNNQPTTSTVNEQQHHPAAIITIMSSSGERELSKIHSNEFCVANNVLQPTDVKFFQSMTRTTTITLDDFDQQFIQLLLSCEQDVSAT
jgi:cysteine synthase A